VGDTWAHQDRSARVISQIVADFEESSGEETGEEARTKTQRSEEEREGDPDPETR